jgi:hypothetical protein
MPEELPEEVEVRTRFRGDWVGGFEVVDADEKDEAVTVRRQSDGQVLPSRFEPDEVRPTRSTGVRRVP